MKKPFLTVYLTPELLDRLVAQAKRRGVPKSTVAEAAIASFLTPDAAQAAARARGRDRYERFVENLGRRLASGRSFTRELAFELEAAARDAPADSFDKEDEGKAPAGPGP